MNVESYVKTQLARSCIFVRYEEQLENTVLLNSELIFSFCPSNVRFGNSSCSD